MTLKNFILFLSTVFILITGCKKVDQYSDVPFIEFKSLTTEKDANGYDLNGKVTISFTDGDGDLGYNSSGNGIPYDDTTSKYFYNFIIKAIEMKNGQWVTDTINRSGRMPYLTQEGTNKALKGDIAMDLFLRHHVSHDTLHFEIYIYDRAFHQSNTVTTSNIVITTH